MVLNELVYSTAMNKCPRCHRGPVFVTNNPYGAGAFRMNETCTCCGLKYEREPGFFYGALYVSYALMSGMFIVWFVSDQLWFHMKTLYLLVAVISTVLLLFPVVLRSSRIIWLNFFVRYDKKQVCAKDIQATGQIQPIKNTTMATFNELINSDRPVLVDFSAEWCGPCKMMAPILAQLKKTMGDSVTILKVDIDKNPAAAGAYQVRSVPTLMLFKKGHVRWRQSGVVPADELQRVIGHNL